MANRDGLDEPGRPLADVLGALGSKEDCLSYSVVVGRSVERGLRELIPAVETRTGKRSREMAEDPRPAQYYSDS